MGVHWKWVANVRRKFRKSKPRNTIIVVHINNSRSLSIGGSTTGGDEEEEVKAVEALEVIEEKGSEEIVERTEGVVDQNVEGNQTVEGNHNANGNDQRVKVNQNADGKGNQNADGKDKHVEGNHNANGNDQHVEVNQNAEGKGNQNADGKDKHVEGNQNADGKGNQNADGNDQHVEGNQNADVKGNQNQNADVKGNQNADGGDQHVEGNQNADGKGNQHVEGNQNADGTSQPVEENQNADGNGGSQLKKEVGLPEQPIAALRIQSFFRGYLARRAFQALRSLVKMQAMVRGVRTRKQSHIALNCMQVLVRLQERVRTRQLLSSVGDNSPLNDSSTIKEVEVQRQVAASIPLST